MTGPIDESRHPIIHVGEDGMHVYTPKEWAALTAEERHQERQFAALRRSLRAIYERRRRQNEPGF